MDEQTLPAPTPPPDDVPAVQPVPAGDEWPAVLPVPVDESSPPAVLPVPATRPDEDGTRAIAYALAAVAFAVVYVVLIVLPGETRYFALDGLQVIPFVGLVLLAYTAEKYEAGRLITILYWGLLIGLTALVCATIAFMLAMDPANFQKAGPRPAGLLQPGSAGRLAVCLFGMMTAVLV